MEACFLALSSSSPSHMGTMVLYSQHGKARTRACRQPPSGMVRARNRRSVCLGEAPAPSLRSHAAPAKLYQSARASAHLQALCAAHCSRQLSGQLQHGVQLQARQARAPAQPGPGLGRQPARLVPTERQRCQHRRGRAMPQAAPVACRRTLRLLLHCLPKMRVRTSALVSKHLCIAQRRQPGSALLGSSKTLYRSHTKHPMQRAAARSSVPAQHERAAQAVSCAHRRPGSRCRRAPAGPARAGARRGPAGGTPRAA